MRDKDHQDLDQEEEAIQEREDADLHQNLQDQGLQERGGLEAMREGIVIMVGVHPGVEEEESERLRSLTSVWECSD